MTSSRARHRLTSASVPGPAAPACTQVSRFIVETDDQRITDNRNLYYANTFGTVLEDTTAGVSPGSPSFDPNEDDAVSDEVLGFTPLKGASDIGAGLRDLTAQFAGLDDPAYAGVAVLITDSTASKPGDLSAAVSQLKAATQAALGADVTVAVVGVGTFVDPAELRQIASVGADGSPLVYEINFFDDISLSLEEALLNIGAPAACSRPKLTPTRPPACRFIMLVLRRRHRTVSQRFESEIAQHASMQMRWHTLVCPAVCCACEESWYSTTLPQFFKVLRAGRCLCRASCCRPGWVPHHTGAVLRHRARP